MVMTFIFILNILSSLSQTLWKDMVITFLLIVKIIYCFFSFRQHGDVLLFKSAFESCTFHIFQHLSHKLQQPGEQKYLWIFKVASKQHFILKYLRVFERAGSSEFKSDYLKVIIFKLFGSEWLNIKMWINNCQWVSGMPEIIYFQMLCISLNADLT